MPSVDMSDDDGDCRVGGRHGGASVTANGAFKPNRSKNEEVPNQIIEDYRINPTWTIRL